MNEAQTYDLIKLALVIVNGVVGYVLRTFSGRIEALQKETERIVGRKREIAQDLEVTKTKLSYVEKRNEELAAQQRELSRQLSRIRTTHTEGESE